MTKSESSWAPATLAFDFVIKIDIQYQLYIDIYINI